MMPLLVLRAHFFYFCNTCLFLKFIRYGSETCYGRIGFVYHRSETLFDTTDLWALNNFDHVAFVRINSSPSIYQKTETARMWSLSLPNSSNVTRRGAVPGSGEVSVVNTVRSVVRSKNKIPKTVHNEMRELFLLANWNGNGQLATANELAWPAIWRCHW